MAEPDVPAARCGLDTDSRRIDVPGIMSHGLQGMAEPLLRLLAAGAADHSFDRKVLIATRRGVGRELLRRLALARGGWIGFEAATPHDLAADIASKELARRGLRIADEFDELALIDASIDAATADRGAMLRPFVEGVGLREAMARSIRALRLGGIDAAMLGRAGFRDRQKREALGSVLDRYEKLLLRERITDRAGVLRQAISGLEAGVVTLPAARYWVLPGHTRRGLPGRLVDLLVDRGAVILGGDTVEGLPVPAAMVEPGAVQHSTLSWLHAVEKMPDDVPAVPLEVFAAGSVNDEIREVLRRVVGAGLRWDEVEIVATDPMTYGAALDAIAQRLDVPVSFAAGLPVGRTRPGRAVEAWLRWVRDDLPEDLLRELIERGDIAPPAGGTTGSALARRMRRMLIGHGRERYEAALVRAARAAASEPVHDTERSPEEIAADRRHEQKVLEDLVAVLRPILDALPPLPRPGAARADGPLVSPSGLARGLLALLRLVPRETAVDCTAFDRLEQRLGRLAEKAERPTTLDGAIAVIAAKLDTRVPAPAAGGAAPWTSSGGRLHLTDIEHGGWTGRAATFVVGLDAGRFPGTATHDTLLGDDDRRRLVAGAAFAPVATTAERLEERRWALAALLARLRGTVTLSYSAWEATEARTVAPAPEMLQALRLVRRDATADYGRLHEATGGFTSAVPRGDARLDAADVWLGLLARDGVLATGTQAVRATYPDLDRGLTARDARAGPAFSPYHGRLRPRAGLDPRDQPYRTVSATELETLGTCPHRYMLRFVLGVTSPEEVEFLPDRWLTPKHRGRLLHDVYRRVLEPVRSQDRNVAEPGFETTALDVLDESIDRMREVLPPPGDAVLELERERLRDEVRLFVSMVRRHGAPVEQLEYRFGAGPEQPPVEIQLPGGTVRARGAIDRVDRESDGRYVVIDYKTGSPAGFGRGDAVFHGGRRLQHALYVAALRRTLGDAARAEYHFPTYRGETRLVRYEEKQLRRARAIIDALLGLVAQGHFFPTDDAEDCRFCDYASICRVDRGIGGSTGSPMAGWARAARDELPELWVLAALRRRPI